MNHTGLVAYAMDDARRDPLRGAFGVHSDARVADFRAPYSNARPRPSSGLRHHRLLQRALPQPADDTGGGAASADLLVPHFDRIDVCVYLRRQDQVAISLHSTRLKSGSAPPARSCRAADADHPSSTTTSRSGSGRTSSGRRTSMSASSRACELLGWRCHRRLPRGMGPRRGEGLPAGRELNESIDPGRRISCAASTRPSERPPGLPREAVQGPLADALAGALSRQGPAPRAFRGRGVLCELPRLERDRPPAALPHPRDALQRELRRLSRRRRTSLEFGADESPASRRSCSRPEPRDPQAGGRDPDPRRPPCLAARRRRDTTRLLPRKPSAHLPAMPRRQRTLAEFLIGSNATQRRRTTPGARPTLRPAHQEYWHFLGVALRAAGDVAGAMAAQERALEIDPDHEPSRQTLAALRADSPKCRRQASARAPDKVRTHRSNAYRQGNHAEPSLDLPQITLPLSRDDYAAMAACGLKLAGLGAAPGGSRRRHGSRARPR